MLQKGCEMFTSWNLCLDACLQVKMANNVTLS